MYFAEFLDSFRGASYDTIYRWVRQFGETCDLPMKIAFGELRKYVGKSPTRGRLKSQYISR